jgi:hypothetical protein
MDKEKKEKIKEKINEVTEKVYDGVNIRGGLDNLYNVVDKVRNITLTLLCLIIFAMTLISLYTIITMPKDIKVGDKRGVEYNNIIAKVSSKDKKENDNTYKVLDGVKEMIPVKNRFKDAVATKEKLKDFTGTKTKITSAIPEFNMEETDGNKKIFDMIKELSNMIKDGVEGKISVKDLEISYEGYGNNIVVSLMIKIVEDGKTRLEMYNYSYGKNKIISLEEYLKELGFEPQAIISKITDEAIMLKQTPDFKKYITDEKGNVMVYLDNGKIIYVEFELKNV